MVASYFLAGVREVSVRRKAVITAEQAGYVNACGSDLLTCMLHASMHTQAKRDDSGCCRSGGVLDMIDYRGGI